MINATKELMKMFKRLTSLVLVFALLSLTLSGCIPSGNSNPTPQPPDPGPTKEPIVLYLPNANVDGFISKAALTDGTVNDIVSLLVGENALPTGCAALNFTMNAADKSCKVDMNTAFGYAVLTTGTAGEYMLIGSLVNTLLTFFGMETITITIEGQTLTSGHNVYDYPLHFYPVCQHQSYDPGPTKEPIVLYLPNANVDGFVNKAAMTDGTANDIVSLLVKENALPAGSAAISFTTNATTKSCKLDMNTAYGNAVSNTGTTGEYMLLGSLVNTLLTFYGMETITITIGGQTLVTGHNVYNYPLGFYKSYN